jgi:excisionase family DNA binding protein
MDLSMKSIAEYLQQINQRQKSIETLLLSQKVIFNFDEVAAYTGLSKSHLYKLTSTSGIPCYKPSGKHIYFNKQEIDEWLMQNRKATKAELQAKADEYDLARKGGVRC